jgi:hypothetical protein
MTEEQKQKLIEYVEFVLKPINGKFLLFEDPMTMYSSIRKPGDCSSIISEENKIIIYHMKLQTKFGEIIMNFGSDYIIKDLRNAVGMSCGYSSSLQQIVPVDKLYEINMKVVELYRSEK